MKACWHESFQQACQPHVLWNYPRWFSTSWGQNYTCIEQMILGRKKNSQKRKSSLKLKIWPFNYLSNQIKSNHFYCHITTAQVPWWVKFLWACSRQCKKTTIYIWTVHIYRLYRRQCAKYTYIYSVHIVYYKDILNYQLHIIHPMGASTLCTLSIHYVVYT